MDSKQHLEDEIFMSNTLNMARLSKCVSKQVCAMLVKDGRTVSTGINGTLPKATNCCDLFGRKTRPDMYSPVPDYIVTKDDYELTKEGRKEHHDWSNKNETHAEMMAMLRCTEDLAGCTLYCTLEPCDTCVKYALAMGIKRIVYLHKYDLKNSEIETLMLKESGAELLCYNDLYGMDAGYYHCPNIPDGIHNEKD